MTRNDTTGSEQQGSWDEPRVVVMLIGVCLLIESGLIYLQAGESQMMISGITAASGLTLLLFALLVPFEKPTTDRYLDEKELKFTKTPAIGAPPTEPNLQKPIDEPVIETPAVVTKPQDKPPPTAVEEKPIEEEPVLTWFQRLSSGLSKTRKGFVDKLKKMVFGKTVIDDELLDDLESTLFESDIGVQTTQELLAYLHKRVEEDEIKQPAVIYQLLKQQLKDRLARYSSEPVMAAEGLTIFLIIGVNGVGKTTTIAKLARKFIKDGKKVVLAAGDTFRAAAIDQLTIWGQRVNAEVIRGDEGGDPGALVFDAIHAARKRKADLLIVDTAGRMHVKSNLMAELKKVSKIIEKETGGPHETMLILDATTGQNAVQQAKLFNEAIPITALVLTKLDGTAKGGVLFAVEEQLQVPVKFIGVGEKMDDLMAFNPEQFLSALFDDADEKTKQSDYKVL